MQIAKIENITSGATIAVGDHRVLFPNTSFPETGPNEEWMQENNCMLVSDNKPYDELNEKIVVVEPYIEGDKVYIVDVVVKTPEEKEQDKITKATKVRQERNKRLTASDWTQLADAPVDKDAWAQYRQALRDVTSQEGFPWQVTWPSTP